MEQQSLQCPICHSADVKCQIERLEVNGQPMAMYECRDCWKLFYTIREDEKDNDDDSSSNQTDD